MSTLPRRIPYNVRMVCGEDFAWHGGFPNNSEQCACKINALKLLLYYKNRYILQCACKEHSKTINV